jgi:hypothetical protein
VGADGGRAPKRGPLTQIPVNKIVLLNISRASRLYDAHFIINSNIRSQCELVHTFGNSFPAVIWQRPHYHKPLGLAPFWRRTMSLADPQMTPEVA